MRRLFGRRIRLSSRENPGGVFTRVPHDVGAHEVREPGSTLGFRTLCSLCGVCLQPLRVATSARCAAVWELRRLREARGRRTRLPTAMRSLPAPADVIAPGVCLQVFDVWTRRFPMNTRFPGLEQPRCAHFVRNSGFTCRHSSSGHTREHHALAREAADIDRVHAFDVTSPLRGRCRREGRCRRVRPRRRLG